MNAVGDLRSWSRRRRAERRRRRAQWWADFLADEPVRLAIVKEWSKILESYYGDRVVYSRGVPFGLRERDGSISPFTKAASKPLPDLPELTRRLP